VTTTNSPVRNESEQAAKLEILRTIPNKFVDLAVNTVLMVDLAALVHGSLGVTTYPAGLTVDLRQKWVRFRAITDGVAFARGEHDGSNGTDTLAGTGGIVLAVAQNVTDPMYVAGSGDTKLTHVKVAGAATLRIFYDSEL